MKFSDVKLPSNKNFGLFFGSIFAIAAIYFFNKGVREAVLVFTILALIFTNLAFIKPDLLLPFNKLWMRFGLLLGIIISPVVLGLIFFIIFAPIGLFMRLFGRDELRLRMKQSNSYWKIREPNESSFKSFKLQF